MVKKLSCKTSSASSKFLEYFKHTANSFFANSWYTFACAVIS